MQVALVNGNALLPASSFTFTTPPGLGGSVAPMAITSSEKTVVQPFGAYFDLIPREPSAGGGLIQPGCTENGDFMSFFVEGSDAGTAQIGARGVHPD